MPNACKQNFSIGLQLALCTVICFNNYQQNTLVKDDLVYAHRSYMIFFMSVVISSCVQAGIEFNFHPVVTAFGGYASLNAANSQSFIGTDGQQFVYENQASGKNTGFTGGFVGFEHKLPKFNGGLWPDYFLQTGVEYDYFGSISVSGENNVGIEPASYTTYAYSYRLQSQQIMGVIKGFGSYRKKYHPYVSVGLGAAFNNLVNYSATTAETGALNLTPLYANHSSNQFTYAIGIGVDTDVFQQIRLGLGYRYSNFGQTQYNTGEIAINNTVLPVPFNLGAPHAFANQFLAQITYKH